MKIEYNIKRLRYLQELYRISDDELVDMISDGLKNPILKNDIYSEEIKVSYLKKIDTIFNKGINFYLDPKNLTHSLEDSVFFRKQSFNSYLNIGSKKIVTHFEEIKHSLSAISKLSGFTTKRKLPVFKLSDNPQISANNAKSILNPPFKKEPKEFLKSLITVFAEYNVYVFEFVETWNKKEKANIDGFFLSPNTIVIKRNASSYRREIFTLIHELGHFFLEDEEIDEIDEKSITQSDTTPIERWCNDFAFYFLVGKYSSAINSISTVSSANDYQNDLIDEISTNTHLSKIALFTRLLIDRKISFSDYQIIKEDLDQRYIDWQKELQRKKDFDKAQGVKNEGRPPKPIKSPLFIKAIQSGYHEGVLNEYDVCKQLNIRPEKIDKYIL